MTRTILACFAHPDDEAFGVAGTLIQHVRRGDRVVLVCATRGERGEISDPSLATAETLPQVREREMRCAADTIGADELILLDYRDSGMAGTEANERADAFMQAPGGVVVAQLVEIVRRVCPEVVLTFDPYGGYGHPDHVAIHEHTVAAVHAAADVDQFPNEGTPWQIDRLFYTPIRPSQLDEMAQALNNAGEDAGSMEQFRDSMHWPEDQIHLDNDVSDVIDAKWQVILCHRTQVGENHPFRKMPEAQAKRIMSRETFALAWPTPQPELRLTGLFDSIH